MNYIIKDSIQTNKPINSKFINLIKEQLKPEKINQMDGVKLIWKDRWIHIRKSNTEPIVRFYSESEDPAESKKLIETAKRLFDN